MLLRLSLRCAAALTTVLVLVLSQAQAQWTITTYKAVAHPEITTMAIADQYYEGARPIRFEGTGTVPMVDLFESGGPGQFMVNLPFPGVDENAGPGDTNDFTARVWGTLVVDVPGLYDFWTDTDDGNRFRLDLDQDGTFDDATESIVPDGGLQGAGDPERSIIYDLAAGEYAFEVSFFERGGGASMEAGYRPRPLEMDPGPQYLLGDPAGGISLLGGQAEVRVVGAATGPFITNFALADALRTSPNEPGFPASAMFEVFNITDSGGDGDFPGGVPPPGLREAGYSEADDYLVAGTGLLVVPPGGITNAIFRSNTDDGGRLLIDVNQNASLADPEDVVILHDVLQGRTNTDSAPISLAEGLYRIEYSFFERGGGAGGELSVSLNGGPFRLVGDPTAVAEGLSLAVIVPEPASTILVGLAVAGLVGFVRRRNELQ